ncbi:MAG: hypothetical protein GWP19_11030 [Planctomycetia bacterium]|nr:hypothetical protein [Planctomycetia bacterium]
MGKIIAGIIVSLFIVACAGHAIIREYKYSYKMKSADDVLYDVITIVNNHNMKLTGTGNTRQSINTTHGIFFVDVVETKWISTGIQNEQGNNYELKYRVWIPVEGSMKVANTTNLKDSYTKSEKQPFFAENVVSIESFVRIKDKGEYKIIESVPRNVFNHLEKIPIEISGILEHTGLSNESKLRVKSE